VAKNGGAEIARPDIARVFVLLGNVVTQ